MNFERFAELENCLLSCRIKFGQMNVCDLVLICVGGLVGVDGRSRGGFECVWVGRFGCVRVGFSGCSRFECVGRCAYGWVGLSVFG